MYFDTFFTPDGEPLPASEQVKVVREGEAVVADVWNVGGRPAAVRRASEGFKEKEQGVIASFSTGPQSIPTHWKQTLFMLKEPVDVVEGVLCF